MSEKLLAHEQCQPLSKETGSLSKADIDALRTAIPVWSVSNDGKSISRDFKCKNYYETTAFLNAVVWIAHQQDHHPDIKLTYNHCHITYSTHSVGGLSRNDFICAAKIDQLLTHD
jgi:4a-hydroxytetrahydrobiopterin dehydratase